MPNPDGSLADAELEARRPSDALFAKMYPGRTREEVRADLERPSPPSVEELLEMIVVRLDTLIELTKRDRRD
jgi:hypothetical protein